MGRTAKSALSDNKKYIISGSAVVDIKNTSGLGKETKVPIIAIYTMHDADKKKQGTLDAQAQDMAIHLMTAICGKSLMKETL